MKKILLTLSAAILLLSCASTDIAESSDVNQEKIWQSFHLELNESKGISQASAMFRFGGSTGTTLHLSGASNISVNGTKMIGKKEMFIGQVYRLKDLNKTKDYSISFTDANGKVLENRMLLNPIAISKFPDSIDVNKNHEIKFTGGQIKENEKVELIIKSNGKNGRREISVYNSIVGSSSIMLNPSNLSVLNNGNGQL